MKPSDPSRVIALAEATDPRCGGKVLGLARLLAAGLRVPPGFVSLGANRAALCTAYAELGAGLVAVQGRGRSQPRRSGVR